MASAREQIADIIRRFEGTAFTNDPADHGGETKFGLTRRFLSAHLGLPIGQLCPLEQLETLTFEQAVEIATEELAMKSGLWRIVDDRLRFAVIDHAFHSGVPSAVRALQRAVQVSPVDGIFGRDTEAYTNRADPQTTRDHVIADRLDLLGSILSHQPLQAKFAAGWLRRIGGVLMYRAA